MSVTGSRAERLTLSTSRPLFPPIADSTAGQWHFADGPDLDIGPFTRSPLGAFKQRL
jgi:hypothetical protein